MPTPSSKAFAALNLPRVIGHRGLAAHAPENTLEGVRTAYEHGLKWVEVDVQLTADGTPVLLHDETLNRTTNGKGKLADTVDEALFKLNAGTWFSPAFADATVPTLYALMAFLKVLGMGVNIELKCTAAQAAPLSKAVARVLADFDGVPVLLSSFEVAALAAAQAHMPKTPRGLLVEQVDDMTGHHLKTLNCTTLHMGKGGFDMANPTLPNFGVPVLVYTVNDAENARTLLGAGVSSVFTDVAAVAALA